MATISVFVSDEEFGFDPTQLTMHAQARWPAATWEHAHGREAEVAAGTLYVPDVQTAAAAGVTVHLGGKALDVEGDDTVIAELLSHLSTAPRFPRTGVEVYEWADAPVALRPATSVEELLEAHDS